MSVTGLMESLTHLLTRTRSFQAFGVSTTSRGDVACVAHSRGFSLQNSTQPIGGRDVSPTDTCMTRSGAANATEAVLSSAAVSAAPRIIFAVFGICDPVPLVGP